MSLETDMILFLVQSLYYPRLPVFILARKASGQLVMLLPNKMLNVQILILHSVM